jgi:Recombination endonuclease VII
MLSQTIPIYRGPRERPDFPNSGAVPGVGIRTSATLQDQLKLSGIVPCMLKIQGYACGMCREPFGEGQLIHVDHDHGCCRVKNRSCGKCVRGLLCHACNVALGHIEHRHAMARAYLDRPRPWEALRA